MKILTITCHDVYNFGASLQAYALQHYLEELGHEVEIIYGAQNEAYMSRSAEKWVRGLCFKELGVSG